MTQDANLARIEAAVRYVEFVQEAAVRANNTAGRLFLIRMVVTVIVLAIAAGAAEAGDTFDLFGLGLELDPWTLLVGGSVLALVMQFFDVPYYERGHQLAYRAAHLYADLGYRVPLAEWYTRWNPHGLQFAAAVQNDPLTGRWQWLSYNIAALGGQTVAGVFLVTTQVIVYYALDDLGHHGFWRSAFLLVPIVTASLVLAKLGLIVRDFRSGARPWSGVPVPKPGESGAAG
jgi:hypothetical protein